MTRQKILITGASSGLGAGMARAFAAKGRDLALCARRVERLEELRAEIAAEYPHVKVAIAALDVDDHEAIPRVFEELSTELGGIDRVIVNAGIGKGWPLGEGKPWANKATINTNLISGADRDRAGDVQTFRRRAPGAHLVGARQHRSPRRQGRLLCVEGGHDLAG